MRASDETNKDKIIAYDNFFLDNVDKLETKNIEKLLEKDPNSDYLIGFNIISLYKEGNIKKAKYIIDSLNFENCGTYTLNGIGFYYHSISQFDKAKSFYLRSIDKDKLKMNFWALANLAYLDEDIGNRKDANYWYQQAINIKPNYNELILAYVNFLIKYQDAENAERMIKKISKYQPLFTFSSWGYIERIKRNFITAKEYFLKSLQIDEWYLESNIGLIATLIDLKEFKSAKEYIDKMKSKYNDISGIWYYEGYMYYCEGRYDESLPFLIKATEMSKDRDSYYIVLILSYIHLKQYLNAEKTIEEAIGIFGHNNVLDSHEILIKMFLNKQEAKELREEYNNYYNTKDIEFLNKLLNDYGVK